MTPLRLALALAVALAAAPTALAQSGKKVLFVSSYHQGYDWSDGIEEAAGKVLRASGVAVEFVRMDTKRRGDEAHKKQAGLDARAAIEKAKPDVVIVADDNAVIYLLQPFYRDAALPFVFCGVNWDASKYGLPYRNATGMVEVGLMDRILAQLREYTKGKRVGFLTEATETERAELKAYREKLHIDFASAQLVKTFDEWKAAFRQLQGEVDVVLLGNVAGIQGFDEKEARAFAEAHTRVPSGAMYEWMMPYAMLGLTKVPEEQGVHAAKTALAILKGAPPGQIPLATNRDARIHLNVKLASRAGVVFKPELARNAVVVK